MECEQCRKRLDKGIINDGRSFCGDGCYSLWLKVKLVDDNDDIEEIKMKDGALHVKAWGTEVWIGIDSISIFDPDMHVVLYDYRDDYNPRQYVIEGVSHIEELKDKATQYDRYMTAKKTVEKFEGDE